MLIPIPFGLGLGLGPLFSAHLFRAIQKLMPNKVCAFIPAQLALPSSHFSPASSTSIDWSRFWLGLNGRSQRSRKD